MALSRRVRWSAFLGALLVLAALALLRTGRPPEELLVVLAGPHEIRLTLADLQSLPTEEGEGSYQNRYDSWSASAFYRGARLKALVQHYFPELWPSRITVVAADGYRVDFSVDRLEDPVFPVVLAFEKDGLIPPAWREGPQIAVLPAGGRVSNEAYDAESAGAYWVQNVVRLEIGVAEDRR